MDRLTSDKDVKDMGMVELAYNSCYANDGKARYRDFDTDIDARQFAMELLERYADIPNEFTCDDDFDEQMIEYMSYGIENPEGLIALFYRNLWAMADLRGRLKRYEDAEEQKRLLKLPCAVGDTVYAIDEGMVVSMKVLEVNIGSLKTGDFIAQITCDTGNGKVSFSSWDFGKVVFFSREQAEQAWKEMNEEVGKDADQGTGAETREYP